MDTLTLWKLALKDSVIRKSFGGVFACDQLPREKRRFNSFIINLDQSHKPGSHWIGVYFKGNTCFYFCSYGTEPKNDFINEFIQRNAKYVEWNTSLFQSLTSTTCGLFSLYFLYRICRSQKLNLLPRKAKYNEKIIKDFAKKNIPFTKKNLKPCDYQTCCSF